MQTRPDHQTIAQRAHELWEAEGRPHGSDLHHWRQAEEEIAAAGRTGGTAEAGTEPYEPAPGDANSATPPMSPI